MSSIFPKKRTKTSRPEVTEKEDQRRKLTPTVMTASFSKEFAVK